MKKLTTKILFLLILITFLYSSSTLAMMPPYLKECLQRGYQTKNIKDQIHCIFPDNSTCEITKFNNKECGQEFLTQDYCVKEGLPVWNSTRCCPGTQSYLPPNTAGHPTCKNISTMQILHNQIQYRPFVTTTAILALLILIMITFMFYLIEKHTRKE